MGNQPYKNARGLLTNKNPELYNFELEFGLTKEDTFKRYFIYKAASYQFRNKDAKEASKRLYRNAVEFCDRTRNEYLAIFDPDGSDGKSKLTRDIYSILWNWNLAPYGNYKKIDFFGTLFGGDTINSVQTAMNYYLKQKNSKEDYCFLYCLQLFLTEQEKFVCQIKELKEFIEFYHTIGNFVLVPAYFNAERGAADFFDAALLRLQTNDWDISTRLIGRYRIKGRKCDKLKESIINLEWGCEENILSAIESVADEYITDECAEKIREYIDKKACERYKIFSKDNFIKYINTMFLWDYVKKHDDKYVIKSLCRNGLQNNEGDCNKYKEWELICRLKMVAESNKSNCFLSFFLNAKYAIERRSYFMVAMLRIALLDSDGKDVEPRDSYNGEYCDMWGDWNVSPIYKEIMDKVFLQEDKVFSGYEEVIVEIEAVISKANIDCKDILKDLREKLNIKHIK